MSHFYRMLLLAILLLAGAGLQAQTIVKGKIIDATTKEPVGDATIQCSDANCFCSCITNAAGEFEIKCTGCKKLSVTYTGYAPQSFLVGTDSPVIYLTSSPSVLQEVVISANRGERVKRSEAPIAISMVGSKTIQETRPITVDQLLNKISGVNMVSLGNEQHQMSIRQPMTTKSLFLYLEDGIPVRTTGLFNHNALLEMNMAATKSIEVIKGPSSSLYGSEAIGGVVNFISLSPTALPTLKVSTRANNLGYKRADLVSSFSSNKWGFVLSGYYADKRNSFMEFTDYHKAIFTARADYRLNNKASVSNSLTWLNYYSDMPSGVDSTMFATHKFTSPQTFTYRKVEGWRYRSTFTQNWSKNSKTTASLVYRNNTIGQNPAYRIKDDYKKVNGVFKGDKELAHGELNASSFHSYAFIGQHKQRFGWKKAVVIGGLSMDRSPSGYRANYIRIKKDTVRQKYASYQPTDSLLTDYGTRINNYAAFATIELSPVEKLRVVASLRYDLFHYNFDNHLHPSSFSGAPDTINQFNRVSPKVGLTYNFSSHIGMYLNYSEGFVPPQVTEMYNGVQVPYLSPSLFYNYETGGWIELIKNKLSADVSIYRLKGTNEIISVRLEDGSFANQNAGKTLHKGIEFGINTTLAKDLSFRLSGTYCRHRFIDYVEKGISYTGNEMNNAPHVLYNAEVWYRPSFVKGLRLGAEVQHVGPYYVDPQNTVKYNGYSLLNLRAGYQLKGFEVWLNVLNTTNNYYSYITTKSAFGYNYQLAEPRNFTAGVSYDFGGLLKKK